ncbi:MAG: zinc-dependent metalloprotease [Bacteroidota bacterium]
MRPAILLFFSLLLFSTQLKAQNQLQPTASLYDIDVQGINQVATNNTQFDFLLPFPNGEWQSIRATESQVLSPAMQASHPDIRTFDLTYGDWKGKLTLANGQLHARFSTPRGLLAIVPSQINANSYKSYYGVFDPEWTSEEVTTTVCNENDLEDLDFDTNHSPSPENTSLLQVTREGVLTTYRLVVVTTGEFEDEHGTNSLAVITNTVQSWNLIFESELGIRLFLVDTRIYTNPATDPFTPDKAGGDSRPNQASEVIAMNFMDNEYDIGHVFHHSTSDDNWGSGGVAGLGVVCSNSNFFSTAFEDTDDELEGPNKAAGWSGSFDNTTNGWVQLSAHEVGHQFSASHTFNGSGASCSGSNHPENSAYEIGSGTTIMSYNRICGPGQNLPDGGENDNYFHAHSISQITDYITNRGGSNCGTITNVNNTAPVITLDPIEIDRIIPARTPFALFGIAVDAQGDDITYTWEQYDEDGADIRPTQGKLGNVAAADPAAPLFRSYPPSDSFICFFPALDNILAGNNNGLQFEALPTVSRTMNFALTARDNNAVGAVSITSLDVTVEDTGSPFQVTSQNTPTTLVADGSATFTITWDVAGTIGGNIQCTEVDILLSLDDGENFTIQLANNTLNDGAYTAQVPDFATTQGRLKVVCSNNIFFDINDAPITITTGCNADTPPFFPDNTVTADQGDNVLNLSLTPDYNTPIPNFTGTLDDADLAANLAFDSQGSCSGPSNSNFADLTEFVASQSGEYRFTLDGPFGQLINIYESSFDATNTCRNFIASTARRSTSSGSVNLFSSVDVNLNAGTTYVMVVMSFAANAAYYGDYTVSYTGLGMFSMPGIGDPGFPYTYIIVDQSDNTIEAFEDDPDLRNYAAGSYLIYGFTRFSATTTADLNANYAGSALDNLEADITAGTLCGDLSENTKSITINGSGDGGTINLSATYDGETTIVDECASIIITTSNIINASDVTMLAQQIIMQPGFHVEAGSDYLARVATCNTAAAVEVRSQPKTVVIELQLFPNPSNGILNWQQDADETIKRIRVINQMGQLMLDLPAPTSPVDVSILPSGIYYLLFEGELSRYQKQLVKQ